MSAASDSTSRPAAVSIRSEVQLPIQLADGTEASARVYSFHGLTDGKEHIALTFGEPAAVPLVRVHSECMTGDVFGSLRCDCGPQLEESLRTLRDEGGYLLYLRQEGRGIGLYAKLDAYRLQEQGQDTYAANVMLGHGADERDYIVAAQMLRALGVGRIELLTNNPEKCKQLSGLGINVAATRRTGVYSSAHNLAYLQAKVRQTGHLLQLNPALSRMEASDDAEPQSS